MLFYISYPYIILYSSDFQTQPKNWISDSDTRPGWSWTILDVFQCWIYSLYLAIKYIHHNITKYSEYIIFKGCVSVTYQWWIYSLYCVTLSMYWLQQNIMLYHHLDGFILVYKHCLAFMKYFMNQLWSSSKHLRKWLQLSPTTQPSGLGPVFCQGKRWREYLRDGSLVSVGSGDVWTEWSLFLPAGQERCSHSFTWF